MIDKEMLNGLNIDELNTLISMAREEKKVRKENARAEAEVEKEHLIASNRETLANLENGVEITFIFKGNETVGQFVKTTEKRFTALVDGEKKSIMFDKFIRVNE